MAARDTGEVKREPLARPGIYLGRMLIFLILVGFLAFILFKQITPAFLANPGLNGLIVGVLLIAVLIAFGQVIRLIDGPLAPVARRYAARPAAARVTTTRFIRLGPAPSAPRSPAVPNWRVPSNRSISSAVSPAPINAASSARVTGSGSSASQAWAASSRSMASRYPGRMGA